MTTLRVRRRAVLPAAIAIGLLAATSACGDDPSDAPGGSGPTTPPVDTGSITTDSQVSSEDEAHPTVPGQPDATSDATGG
jgi:hypothetical protein